MVYQDHLTKFCILGPLRTKRAAEVTFQSMDIFLSMEAQAILQSNNGSEFTAQVITEGSAVKPSLGSSKTTSFSKPRFCRTCEL